MFSSLFFSLLFSRDFSKSVVSSGSVDGADLVAQALGSNDGDLIADALVGLEVEGQAGVVPLNDDLGGLLDSLGTNATHFGGIEVVWWISE